MNKSQAKEIATAMEILEILSKHNGHAMFNILSNLCSNFIVAYSKKEKLKEAGENFCESIMHKITLAGQEDFQKLKTDISTAIKDFMENKEEEEEEEEEEMDFDYRNN